MDNVVNDTMKNAMGLPCLWKIFLISIQIIILFYFLYNIMGDIRCLNKEIEDKEKTIDEKKKTKVIVNFIMFVFINSFIFIISRIL